ncbi:DUF6493 family protein [Streptomyces sp. NRRL S-813]|uniref:DUF7824 domain-containing protein n=1 Tax=Streptomyces sp. NRRL S-813 TaxID=1463919 RepID=UPI0004C2921B|nr:DUF6493 family protein [Streptomyces sp. NRRL S-813]
MTLIHLVEAGDVEGVLRELAALTPDERAAHAEALEDRRAQKRADWHLCPDEERAAQLAAELGCRTDPVAAADWILREHNLTLHPSRRGAWILDVVDLYPATWRAELLAQLAERSSPGKTIRFDLLEHLLHDTGCPVPTSDGFIESWLSWRGWNSEPPAHLRGGAQPCDTFLARLRADGLTPKLLPLVLDRPGLSPGGVEMVRHQMKKYGSRHWRENTRLGVFISLSAEGDGLVDRAALIRRFFALLPEAAVSGRDAALALRELALTPAEHASVARERLALAEPLTARLLQDGTPASTAPPLAYLRALALTPAENAPLLRDHVAMLDLSSPVAAYGQEVLIGLDEAGFVEPEVLTEICERVLLRPEKKLVRAQLAWLNRVAVRDASRTGRLLTDMALTFQHPDVGLQERALDLVARHLPTAGAGDGEEQVRSALREAAAFLSPGLTARAAELFGPPEQNATEPSTTGPSTGPSDEVLPDILSDLPEPAPVGPVLTTAEVAPEVAVALADRDNVVAFERALDGLVRHARLDRGTLAKMLEPVVRKKLRLEDWQWYGSWSPLDAQLDIYDVVTAVRGDERRSWHIHLRREHGNYLTYYAGSPNPPAELLEARLTEAIELIGSGAQPYLLALPTQANGAVDAATLVERIAEFESLGVTPAPIDLAQALLRVTPTDDARVRDAAGALGSDAGRRLARWLDQGGAPHRDTTPEKWPTDHPTDAERGWWDPADPGTTDHDLPLPPVAAALLGPHTAPFTWASAFWLAQLPHHRDEMAARLGHTTHRMLPRLMETHGTAGYATHWQIAHRLGGNPKEADAVVDALLVLAAQGQLDARLLAGQWQALLRHGASTHNRATAALRAAAETGAWATVWSILEAALPALLRDKPVNGAGAILALAVECASRSGAKGSIPEVDEVAARKGSSQIVKNARLLRDVLR